MRPESIAEPMSGVLYLLPNRLLSTFLPISNSTNPRLAGFAVTLERCCRARQLVRMEDISAIPNHAACSRRERRHRRDEPTCCAIAAASDARANASATSKVARFRGSPERLPSKSEDFAGADRALRPKSTEQSEAGKWCPAEVDGPLRGPRRRLHAFVWKAGSCRRRRCATRDGDGRKTRCGGLGGEQASPQRTRRLARSMPAAKCARSRSQVATAVHR